jgi:hypothetical protein
MGRIFDDRGNRMTPSHSNRDGIRYRYYVFHVLLQRRKTDAADSLGPRDFAASGPPLNCIDSVRRRPWSPDC